MKGRAVILRTGALISPFGETASEAFFSGESVRETQDRAFGRIGFEIVRVGSSAEAKAACHGFEGPVVLMPDHIFLTEKAAKDFVHEARRYAKPPAALALEMGAAVDYTLPLQDTLRETSQAVYDVFWVDGAELPEPTESAEWIRSIRDASSRVLVPMRELVSEIPLPVIGQPDQRPVLRYPVTSTVVVSIEHWTHILWLNQIAFGIRWVELLRRRPFWGLFRALSAFSLNGERILMKLVHKGSGCEIHPTAHLSGSILGRDVKVGAHVTIRNSIIGDGAVLQDHAVLINSVIGANTLVTENSFLVSTVSYPDATLGNYKLQVSLIGRGAYVHAWAGFIDAKFLGTVKVSHRGALMSTERQFLGSVVGHRAKVAAKVLIQPGREIPNDSVIVMRPDEVVSTVPAQIAPGQPMVRDHGTLVPLGEESQSP